MRSLPRNPASARRRAAVSRKQAARTPLRARLQETREELAAAVSEIEVDQLRQAQEELEESGHHYADLFDFAPVGYLTLDSSGCIRTANLTAARLCGMERARLVGRPFLTLVARPERRKFLLHLGKLRRGIKEAATELQLAPKQQPPIPVQLISVHGGRGRFPLHFPTAIVDLTERKHAEAELRESEARFRIMAEAAPVMIWMSGQDARCSYVNKRWLEFSGRTLEEELGSGWTERIHPEDAERCLKVYQEAFKARREFRLDYRLERFDGTYRWVQDHGAPRFASAREFVGYVGSCVDITERREAEDVLREAHAELERRVRERTAALSQANEALRETEARLEAILNHSPSLIFIKDPEGRYVHVNRQFERLVDQASAQIVGKSDADIFPVDEAATFRASDLKVLESGVPRQFDRVWTEPDGRHVGIVTKFPLRDSEGNIFAVGGIVTDITERRRLEEEVLRISEHEKRRIAQDLHDGLGQQLAGVACLSNVLKKDLARQPSAKAAADKISRLLDTAVAQTRGLARGLHPVATEPAGLMAALQDMASRISDLFRIRCQFVCPQPVMVEDNAVATHLYRIAQEAVANSLRHGRAKQVEINLSSAPQALILSVSDDGLGFKKPTSQSKGLGLRIMNHRADTIGGTLQIDPGPRGGTKVVCSLPEPAARWSNNGQTRVQTA